MPEVNEKTYKRALYRMEDHMKERAAKIEKLKVKLAEATAENARLMEQRNTLAELAHEVHVIDDEGRFYCPVCRGESTHREYCEYALAMRVIEECEEAKSKENTNA